jgi:hypothetical protein
MKDIKIDIGHNEPVLNEEELESSKNSSSLKNSKTETRTETKALKKRVNFLFFLVIFLFCALTVLGYFGIKKQTENISSAGSGNIKKLSEELTLSMYNISKRQADIEKKFFNELESLEKKIEALKKTDKNIKAANSNNAKKLFLKADKKNFKDFETKLTTIEKSLKVSINTSFKLKSLLQKKTDKDDMNAKLDDIKKDFQLKLIRFQSDIKDLIALSKKELNISMDKKTQKITDDFNKSLKYCLNQINELKIMLYSKTKAQSESDGVSEQELLK